MTTTFLFVIMATTTTAESERIHARDLSLSKMNTEFFALPGLHPLDESGGTRDSRQMCNDEWSNEADSDCLNATHAFDDIATDDGVLSGMLHRNSWAIPMLTFSAVNVVMIVTFEVYVICKATRDTPSRRHLFLGQMLLLGLLMGSLLGFAYALEPTDLSCAAIRFGTGMSYAFIYSSLLVKLVFLISLNTGVYLPATYQALLFLFCMLVQTAIGIQWLTTSGPLCDYVIKDHMLSLLYVIFLILFSTTLAVKSRHFRDNYREAKYIGMLMAVTLPIWVAWIMAGLVLREVHHPACAGSERSS